MAPKTSEDIEKLKQETEVNEHLLSIEDLCRQLETDPEKGLTDEEATHRLERYGLNQLTPPKTKPEWLRFIEEVFLGFFNMLLLVGGILCFVSLGVEAAMGQPTTLDSIYLGVVLILVVVVTGTFGYLQSGKSSKIMESFRKMVPQKAVVIRGGSNKVIDTTHVVLGDVIQIKGGDRIPADLRIIKSYGLQVDNSALTGESEAQTRTENSTQPNPLEASNLAFYSTCAVDGAAVGICIRTGDETIVGRIANLASSLQSNETPIAKEIEHFVHVITVISIILGVTFCILMLVLRGSWLEAMIFLISIIIASVPEGLLVTFTVALTLTAKRMASKNCLVKNLQAVETLGSCSTICSDKTGTLTQNRMTVTHTWYDNRILSTVTDPSDLAGDEEEHTVTWDALCRCARLCSRAAFQQGQEGKSVKHRLCTGDASETSILRCMELYHPEVMDYRRTHEKVCEIPFNSTNKFQVSVHVATSPSPHYLVQMKGAPERIIEVCSNILYHGKTLKLTDKHREEFQKACNKLGEEGERVIAFCDLDLPISEFPIGYKFEVKGMTPNFPITGLRLIGLLSMIDPPRAGVPGAVRKCRSAGVKVIMVTGDHPITARAIARSVGIIGENYTVNELAEQRGVSIKEIAPGESKSIVITGTDVKQMSSRELRRVIRNHREIVFARTSPQQKLLIVEACQDLGHIVAVTGDGVNDSPALKKADIGISMGIEGSDVTKQAADMILLDDNFASIVMGIEEGRIIFENLKKSITYTLSSKIPEMIPFLVYATISIPLPLGTNTILMIDLGTDLWPAIALAYEDAEADIMKQRPRNPHVDRLVTQRLLGMAYLILGVHQVVGVFVVYFMVMAELGFRWPQLLNARTNWEDRNYHSFEDNFGQEWTYEQRRLAELSTQTAVFVNIVTMQWAVLVVCKTRRNSLFLQGMYNYQLTASLFFETALAFAIAYVPYFSDTALRTHPLRWWWWLVSLPVTVSIFVFDEIRKMLIRRRGDEGYPYRGTFY